METVARLAIRLGSRGIVAWRLGVRLEGLEQLPRAGPVLIACRHYHHFYDGCILLGLLPRPVHILVALDWVRGRWGRRLLEWGCAMARWPVVLRDDAPLLVRGASAYRVAESGRYLRRGLRAALALLREGRVLVVFPEGYPNIDPSVTLKRDAAAYLPFRSGFVHLAALAARGYSRKCADGPARERSPGYTRDQTRVAIVPAGLEYRRGPRWQVTLRLGPPLYLEAWPDRANLIRRVEEEVRRLSGTHPNTSP